MFCGDCHDQFEEFGLRANPALLSARSRVFWTSAHVMTSPLNRCKRKLWLISGSISEMDLHIASQLLQVF